MNNVGYLDSRERRRNKKTKEGASNCNKGIALSLWPSDTSWTESCQERQGQISEKTLIPLQNTNDASVFILATYSKQFLGA